MREYVDTSCIRSHLSRLDEEQRTALRLMDQLDAWRQLVQRLGQDAQPIQRQAAEVQRLLEAIRDRREWLLKAAEQFDRVTKQNDLNLQDAISLLKYF